MIQEGHMREARLIDGRWNGGFVFTLLKSYYTLNTNNKSPEEVTDIICEKIIKIERVK